MTACVAAAGTTSSASRTSTSPSATRTKPSTERTRIPGPTRPVLLAINDYNTEQEAKRLAPARARRPPARTRRPGRCGRPSVPPQPVDADSSPWRTRSLRSTGLPVTQVVSEIDVTTGTPVTEARLIDQGYFYRDAFRMLRAHADEPLLGNRVGPHRRNRSWRVASGAPLVFDDELPGEAGLPRRSSTASSRRGSDRPSSSWPRATSAIACRRVGAPAAACDRRYSRGLPVALARGLRSSALRPCVRTRPHDADRSDHLRRRRYATHTVVRRDGGGDAAERRSRSPSGGWVARAELPRLRRGDRRAGGLRRPGQRTEPPQSAGTSRARWWHAHPRRGSSRTRRRSRRRSTGDRRRNRRASGALANTVSTDVAVQGAAGGATALVRTLWRANTLYVLAR